MKILKRAGAWLLAAALTVGMAPSAGAYSTGVAGKATVVSCGLPTGIISADNTLWMWGYRGMNILNLSQYEWHTDEWAIYTPLQIMDNVSSIAVGVNNGVATVIKTDGSLWMWEQSESFYGPKERAPSRKVMDDVAAASAGLNHTGAIKTDGSLWMWGQNSSGQIGNGTNVKQDTPVKIMDNVAAVSLGSSHSAAIKTDGSLWMWGWNASGQVGNGATANQLTPVKIMDNVGKVSLSHNTSAAIKTDGSLWMWGGTIVAPTKLMDNAADISFGDYHAAVMKTDGSLWTWGDNSYGQIGNGTLKDATAPIKIMEDVSIVAAGIEHNVAIKTDGTVWVWGDNHLGELGLGKNAGNSTRNEKYNCQNVPVQLNGLKFTLPEVSRPCTVTLNLAGGTGATSVKCDKGAPLTPPNNPTREGYYFAGWYVDSACTKPWNFDADKVTDSITLYAKWEKKTTATVIAEPSTQKTVIDGKAMTFNTYILRDAAGNAVNFVKLRDVAYVLDGTAAQFNVDWRNNAIRLDAKQPYTTKNGAEMTVPSVVSAPAKTSETPVLTGGVTAPLEAFLLTDQNGGGHNYFKLRDIGKVAGFNVTWDNAAQSIVITTTEPYAG
ncbi:InlB B-repeat-containing protein [Butyricicoccus faecihominis]|uniref:InlB B-repeat-containing protein n=1 Tax=Butyricicoccus faecihominis TaxID=1712515 RepID=UPI002478C59A|nr:InlB B-repeat-containing protein [Butyricicoccus faecihominis]MCQ5129968.1 InlB B-repeat-containing protein [Butyricicoccus faecihominis]